MPFEALSKDEVVALIKDWALKILDESGLKDRVLRLEKELDEVKTSLAELSRPPPDKSELLKKDLGGLLELLEMDLTKDPMVLKPRHWLKDEEFRAVNEVVKRLGGSWNPSARAFIIKK
jgi:hypothetical protein